MALFRRRESGSSTAPAPAARYVIEEREFPVSVPALGASVSFTRDLRDLQGLAGMYAYRRIVVDARRSAGNITVASGSWTATVAQGAADDFAPFGDGRFDDYVITSDAVEAAGAIRVIEKGERRVRQDSSRALRTEA